MCFQVLNQRYSDKLYKEALDGSLEDVNKLSKLPSHTSIDMTSSVPRPFAVYYNDIPGKSLWNILEL